MYTALLVVFLLVAIALVGMILMQQGKGADMGASFGAGASATLFFVLSLVLGNMTSNKTGTGSKFDNLAQPVQTEQKTDVPAAPAAPNSDIPR